VSKASLLRIKSYFERSIKVNSLESNLTKLKIDFEQAGGSLTILTDRYVNRHGIDASQFQAVNPLYIIILAPFFTWLWGKLSRNKIEPYTPYKFFFGLLQMAIGYAIIVFAAKNIIGSDSMIPVVFLMGMYLFHTTGELSLSPVGLSMVTKLSPAKIVGFVMGSWFLSIALAHKIAGVLGQMIASPGNGSNRDTALNAYAEVYMTCRADGTIQLCAGVTDGGQGAATALSQIAAESTGVSLERIKFGRPDTDITPDSGTSTASRLTYVVGRAVYEAGKALREELRGYAAHFLKSSENMVGFENDQFFTEDKTKTLTLDALIGLAIAEGFPLQSKGYFNPDTTQLDPDTGQGAPYGTYAFATQGALVKVDRQTGQATVLKVIAAHDVGHAINPSAVEAQIQGGVVMGLGLGIMECVHVEQGEILNPDFQGYLIPSTMDMPEIKAIIVEDPEPSGPYGAKGVGEPALIPTAPAICNALAKATACRFFETPVTPESIWTAMHSGKR